MFVLFFVKKILKIPKSQSESVHRRRTDNTMDKRKRTNNDLQSIYIQLKIDYHEPHQKTGVNSGAPEG